MSKKYLSLTLLIVFIFTILSVNFSYAESEQSGVTPTPKSSVREGIKDLREEKKTENRDLKTDRKESLESLRGERKENVRKLVETKDVDSFLNKRKEIQTTYKNQTDQYKALREANKEEFKLKEEELKENAKLDREEIKDARLDEKKIERLEKLKEHITRTESRMLKVVEYFYERLAKLSEAIDAQAEEGFGDNAAIKKKISDTEEKVNGVKIKINTFGEQYDGIESMTLEEINKAIKTMKTDISSIIGDFKIIRTSLKEISKSI
jgi:hypothetical protein